MRTLALSFLLLSFGCTTRYYVSDEYLQLPTLQEDKKCSHQTVIMFLVDGLSYSILEKNFQRDQLPHLKKFFLKYGALLKAHSVFPTLTYTNISGVLKESPIHRTESFGNKLIKNEHVIDFESVSDRNEFTNLMHGNNIFARLAKNNCQTVSLDYGLGADATVETPLDFQSGYSLSQADYRYSDKKKIDALALLLKRNEVKNWPEFIFLHLIGIDFLSHAFGANSVEVQNHLRSLDQDLKTLFGIIESGERKRNVVSLLTSDHGFALQVKKKIDWKSIVKKFPESAQVLNEARMASVYFNKPPNEETLVKATRTLFTEKNIEIVSYKVGQRVRIMARDRELYFDEIPGKNCGEDFVKLIINDQIVSCSDELPPEFKNLFYPFFIENIASFFKASNSPDLILIPNHESIFETQGLGFHGGPTEDETIVPLLMRNAITKRPEQIPANWQLLKFVK